MIYVLLGLIVAGAIWFFTHKIEIETKVTDLENDASGVIAGLKARLDALEAKFK